MNRSRDYYRKMRAKHIRRKKNIVNHWKWWADNDYEYYPHNGMYSKGKIHCSCPLCKVKARHNGKHVLTEKELISIMKMNEELNEVPTPNPPSNLKPLTSKDIYGKHWRFAEG